ncbi:MAG: glycogen synthase GlgA [Candidatus Omnitrophica bacterium]|nr:glycogen synthase GlgA [Candidatus Omnitrophota bacterium]
MEIVFVASEMTPFAQTGGLADVLGSLPHEIAKQGHSVSVFLPKYRTVSEEKFSLEAAIPQLNVPLGSDIETGKLLCTRIGEVTVFFIDEPSLFSRDGLYGTPMGDFPDNDVRFVFFARSVLESLKRLKLRPDIIHCHDWQSGLVPVYLKTIYRSDPFFKGTKTIFTIHNLAYQGNFPPDSLSATGLTWEEFRYERLEFYGKISFLKGGLVYSDLVTTVSKRYAEEIQTREFGCGMEGVLANRKEDLFGIVNGIDTEEWDPAQDPALSQNFDANSLEKRAICKAELQKENRLVVDPKIPLFGFVGRLAEQKGIDILEPLLDDMVDEGWQLVLLGTGDGEYETLLRRTAEKYPKSIAVNLTFNTKFSKRVYGGVDIFLMTSQFEPCGLGQMYSLRYGAAPLAREVGGLADTVKEFNAATGEGNGFLFLEYSSKALFATMKHAISVFRDQKKWHRLIKNGMACDFSWAQSARQYIDIYKRAEKRSLKV